jgi:quinol monooxygenase YgiN
MTYMQSIQFKTDQRGALLELMARWSADAHGPGTARRGTMLEDRSAPGSFVMAVEFESQESAAENSARPETGAFSQQFAELCSEGPEFREFDVVEVYGRD